MAPSTSRKVSERGDLILQALAGIGATRADFVAWYAANNSVLDVGSTVSVAGFSYRYTGASSAIGDMPGLVPHGDVYPDHWKENTTPGTTVMTDAIRNAMAYVGTGDLLLTNQTYLIDDTILWTTATRIRGQNAFFRNDYTNTALEVSGSVLKLKTATNKNMFTVRADISGLEAGQFPRHHGGLFNVMLHGNRSLDDAVTAVDLNNNGHVLELQGVSYFTVRDCVFFRGAEHNITSGSYDYGDGAGARGCNNLDFSNFASIGAAKSPIRAFGGDSKFSNMVLGYCGDPANISAGPVSGSLIWNMQQEGILLSSGTDGHAFTGNEIYDCKYAGLYLISGGDWVVTGNTIKNNGRAADGNNNHTCGVLVSASVRSATITSNAIFDSDAGTQLRGIYSSGAPTAIVAANRINCPTANIAISDMSNVSTGDDWLYGVLSADYTLTSTTSLQKLFNWSTNGAITLPTGYYWFAATIYITGMDPTSGNAKFDMLGAGGATIDKMVMGWTGQDATSPSSAAAQSGGFALTAATGTNMSTSAVGTAMGETITGSFQITAAGTVIPSIALVTAIAAVVNKGSSIRFKRVGASNINGVWS
jgi:parallel beta-helix repeat protein